MAKALLLHGTDGTSNSNWLPWLSGELRRRDWQVWVPDLPRADEPHIGRYNEHLFATAPWDLDEESFIIGHSAGTIAGLGYLQANDPSVHVDTCVLVSSLKDNIGWSKLDRLFEIPLDFGALRERADRFVFLHSDDDPYCPLAHAEYLAEQLDGDLVVLPGQGHFNVESNPPCLELPFVLDFLLEEQT